MHARPRLLTKRSTLRQRLRHFIDRRSPELTSIDRSVLEVAQNAIELLSNRTAAWDTEILPLKWSENRAAGSNESLAELVATYIEATTAGLSPYGGDSTTELAKNALMRTFDIPGGSIHFLGSGTAANALALSYLVPRNHRILSPATAHILELEANAVSVLSGGAYVQGVETSDGKIVPEHVFAAMRKRRSTGPDQTTPLAAVFISNAVENGDSYSILELEQLSAACRSHGIKLGIDGARLPYALASRGQDPATILKFADFVTLSATKTGGLFGSAILFSSPIDEAVFARLLKSTGHRIDATYYVASQFLSLYRSDLWQRLARRSLTTASMVATGLGSLGITAVQRGNLVFVRLPRKAGIEIADRYRMYVWEYLDQGVIDTISGVEPAISVRIAIPPSITDEDISRLLADIAAGWNSLVSADRRTAS